MNIDVWILSPNVMQKIDIPRERQFWMMHALHQNLHPASRGKFIQLLIDLLEAKNIMILIALRPIKRAEFAVNVADIGIVNIAIDDVSHDLAAPSAVTFRFCQIASGSSKHTEFLELPAI